MTYEVGSIETGVDVGGIFKEFWTDLSTLAFNPNYALFRVTEGEYLEDKMLFRYHCY